MNFKFNANVFKNSVEDHKRVYGENYDPGKNYPGFAGTIEIPKSQLQDFVAYLHYACQTELKRNYLNEEVVPIRMSGWAKQSETTGKSYLGLSFEADYQTKLAAQQAQQAEAASVAPPAPAPAPVDQAAQSLAAATGGDVLF